MERLNPTKANKTQRLKQKGGDVGNCRLAGPKN